LHSRLNWDDLRLVLAIARAGTLSGAARTLEVTHSTVFRRLGAVEQEMGVRLFDRFRDGYAATTAGESAAEVAARIADEVLALERRLSGQDLRPSGTVRITTTDTIGALLMPHLNALRIAHPQIRLEVTISNTMVNLTPISLTQSTACPIICRKMAAEICLRAIGSVWTRRWPEP
jgi:DNA-binding transcriptional LysR family regulator